MHSFCSTLGMSPRSTGSKNKTLLQPGQRWEAYVEKVEELQLVSSKVLLTLLSSVLWPMLLGNTESFSDGLAETLGFGDARKQKRERVQMVKGIAGSKLSSSEYLNTSWKESHCPPLGCTTNPEFPKQIVKCAKQQKTIIKQIKAINPSESQTLTTNL